MNFTVVPASSASTPLWMVLGVPETVISLVVDDITRARMSTLPSLRPSCARVLLLPLARALGSPPYLRTMWRLDASTDMR